MYINRPEHLAVELKPGTKARMSYNATFHLFKKPEPASAELYRMALEYGQIKPSPPFDKNELERIIQAWTVANGLRWAYDAQSDSYDFFRD